MSSVRFTQQVGWMLLLAVAVGVFGGLVASWYSASEHAELSGKAVVASMGDARAGSHIANVPAAAGTSADAENTNRQFARQAMGSASEAYAAAWELSKVLRLNKVPATLAKPPLLWRIAGTTSVAGDLRVLVVYDGVQTPEAKRVGDKLPGGAEILGVEGSSVAIKLNGQRVFLNPSR